MQIKIDDPAADSIGAIENFLGKVEKGSGSVNWGKLFRVFSGLGVHVILDVPADVARMLGSVLQPPTTSPGTGHENTR